MPTSETLTGKVLSANDKGIKLDGYDDWFNYTTQHAIDHANRGDTVSVKVSGKWINELSVVSGGSSNGSTPNQAAYDNRQTSIERLACLKAASNFLGLLSTTREEVKSEHVILLAEKFLAWVQQEPDGE